MQRLRSMRIKPSEVHVYRGAEWSKVMSNELLPGDICLIHTESQKKAEKEAKVAKVGEPGGIAKKELPKANIIPCDLLILSGGGIVDESILTGESVP